MSSKASNNIDRVVIVSVEEYLCLKLKGRVYFTLVISIPSNSCETWSWPAEEVAGHLCLRSISWTQ